jgi:uncharacterized protein DUF4326
MTKLYNKHHKDAPKDAVYIGRGSKWGNPFPIQYKGRTRKESISLFRKKVDDDEEFRKQIKEELRGKDMVCFCSPKECHGDYLMYIANEEERKF